MRNVDIQSAGGGGWIKRPWYVKLQITVPIARLVSQLDLTAGHPLINTGTAGRWRRLLSNSYAYNDLTRLYYEESCFINENRREIIYNRETVIRAEMSDPKRISFMYKPENTEQLNSVLKFGKQLFRYLPIVFIILCFCR